MHIPAESFFIFLAQFLAMTYPKNKKLGASIMSFNLNTITIDTILPIIQEVANTYLTRENSQAVTVKGDSNFVTEVDTKIEQAKRNLINR